MASCAKTHAGRKGNVPRTLSELTMHPAFKYVGFALLFSWHYGLWFIPHMFIGVELLDDHVTVSWLVNLTAIVISLLLIAFALGRKRRLSSIRWLFTAAPVLMCAATLSLCLLPQALGLPGLAYALAFFLGVVEAVLWILWGEHYASVKAHFSLRHIGTTFGCTVLATVTTAWLLPPYAASAFVAALPLISGALLGMAERTAKKAPPVLLPKVTAQGGLKNMTVVSVIAFLASMACYFLVAIIPWEILPMADLSFTVGIIGGAVLVLALAGISAATKDKANIFTMYPGIIVILIVAFALFVADPFFYFISFTIATGISSLLEILLIMYFGILTSKGYVTPATAFAFSGAFVRAGIATGNIWAVGYESAPPSVAAAVTPETCLALICLLAALLVPLVRQEFSIVALTAAPPTKAELDEICSEVAKEFKLSARESEVLVLIARGHTTNSMAEKLVISPYTINTHIRHIYDKMQIHKRSELLNYLNMQRSDF